MHFGQCLLSFNAKGKFQLPFSPPAQIWSFSLMLNTSSPEHLLFATGTPTCKSVGKLTPSLIKLPWTSLLTLVLAPHPVTKTRLPSSMSLAVKKRINYFSLFRKHVFIFKMGFGVSFHFQNVKGFVSAVFPFSKEHNCKQRFVNKNLYSYYK